MISHGNFAPVPPVGVNPAPLIIIICGDVTTILLINKLHDQREISFLVRLSATDSYLSLRC